MSIPGTASCKSGPGGRRPIHEATWPCGPKGSCPSNAKLSSINAIQPGMLHVRSHLAGNLPLRGTCQAETSRSDLCNYCIPVCRQGHDRCVWAKNVDTLGIEPRASRMLRGCDTTTPCAQLQMYDHANMMIRHR
jgi:hypothetical protein